MLRDLLSIGDKIDIRLVDRKGKPAQKAKSYISQFVEFAEEDVVHIMAPIIAGKTIILETGKTFNLLFYTEKGLYHCNCVILRNFKENKTVVCAVRISSNPEKFQRRQYFRLDCNYDIEYRKVTEEEETLDKMLAAGGFGNEQEKAELVMLLGRYEKDWMHGTMTDLSGGGAKFTSTLQHYPGDKLRIKLDFIYEIDIKKPILNVKVISSNHLTARSSVFEHRVEFFNIMQREREAVIKYIFDQERKRRKIDRT